jgi:hypothetical protein
MAVIIKKFENSDCEIGTLIKEARELLKNNNWAHVMYSVKYGRGEEESWMVGLIGFPQTVEFYEMTGLIDFAGATHIGAVHAPDLASGKYGPWGEQ